MSVRKLSFSFVMVMMLIISGCGNMPKAQPANTSADYTKSFVKILDSLDM